MLIPVWGGSGMLLLLSLVAPLLASNVVINELLVNVDGVDDEAEWIELYNSGSEIVDLSGWVIEWGTSTFSKSETLSGFVLAPGDFVVVGGSLVAETDIHAFFDFGNAASSGDAVRLLDAAMAVIDTVVYGPDNSDEWFDDSGEIAVSIALGPGEDESIARHLDGVDTDLSAADFFVAEAVSPGRSNVPPEDTGGPDTGGPDTGGPDTGSGGGPDTGDVVDIDDTGHVMGVDDTASTASTCPGSGDIKINELLPDPEGLDGGYEWVELYNAGSEVVSLGGWKLQSATSGSPSTITAFSDGLSLAPEEHLLIGGEYVLEADVLAASMSLGNGSNTDIVLLKDCEDKVADTVVYGSPNAGEDEWVDDSGAIATSLAPQPGKTESLARLRDGHDTDACGVDFVISNAPTPGTANPDGEPVDPVECVADGEALINEILPAPSASPDDGHEWVELYNPGADATALAGWTLQWGTGDFGKEATFEAGVTLSSAGFLLVGGVAVADVDVAMEFTMGNAGSNADAVRLVDCDGVVRDTVIYGSPNDDAWPDDSGEVATGLAPKPGDDESVARVEDGYDTNDCGIDFVVTETPTPGGPNESLAPTVCTPGEGFVIKINEILPNPESTDSEGEFIELYNAGDETVSLDGWGIEAATSRWDERLDFTFGAGVTISAGHFIVIGGGEIPEADFYIEDGNTFTLGNVSKSPDGVRLVDCAGEVQDTVLYGDPEDLIEDVELTDDAGGQTMGTMPEENLALGRDPDGADTDDNEVDLFTNMPPSPGAANIRGGGGGGDTSKECGCARSGDAPTGSAGPAEAAAPLAGLAGLLMLIGLRRREDPPCG